MPDNVAFCPGCGRRTWVPGQEANPPATSRPPARAINLSAPSTSSASVPIRRKENLIAASAYITFFPAIFFVLFEPLKRNRFIRFHSFQSIFLAIASIPVAIALRILYSLLGLIPLLLASTVVVLGWVILWLVLLVKAFQGEMFRLPWIGSLAEKA
jgi:uncharacterized membrane protein